MYFSIQYLMLVFWASIWNANPAQYIIKSPFTSLTPHQYFDPAEVKISNNENYPIVPLLIDTLLSLIENQDKIGKRNVINPISDQLHIKNDPQQVLESPGQYITQDIHIYNPTIYYQQKDKQLIDIQRIHDHVKDVDQLDCQGINNNQVSHQQLGEEHLKEHQLRTQQQYNQPTDTNIINDQVILNYRDNETINTQDLYENLQNTGQGSAREKNFEYINNQSNYPQTDDHQIGTYNISHEPKNVEVVSDHMYQQVNNHFNDDEKRYKPLNEEELNDKLQLDVQRGSDHLKYAHEVDGQQVHPQHISEHQENDQNIDAHQLNNQQVIDQLVKKHVEHHSELNDQQVNDPQANDHRLYYQEKDLQHNHEQTGFQQEDGYLNILKETQNQQISDDRSIIQPEFQKQFNYSQLDANKMYTQQLEKQEIYPQLMKYIQNETKEKIINEVNNPHIYNQELNFHQVYPQEENTQQYDSQQIPNPEIIDQLENIKAKNGQQLNNQQVNYHSIDNPELEIQYIYPQTTNVNLEHSEQVYSNEISNPQIYDQQVYPQIENIQQVLNSQLGFETKNIESTESRLLNDEQVNYQPIVGQELENQQIYPQATDYKPEHSEQVYSNEISNPQIYHQQTYFQQVYPQTENIQQVLNSQLGFETENIKSTDGRLLNDEQVHYQPIVGQELENQQIYPESMNFNLMNDVQIHTTEVNSLHIYDQQVHPQQINNQQYLSQKAANHDVGVQLQDNQAANSQILNNTQTENQQIDSQQVNNLREFAYQTDNKQSNEKQVNYQPINNLNDHPLGTQPKLYQQMDNDLVIYNSQIADKKVDYKPVLNLRTKTKKEKIFENSQWNKIPNSYKPFNPFLKQPYYKSPYEISHQTPPSYYDDTYSTYKDYYSENNSPILYSQQYNKIFNSHGKNKKKSFLNNYEPEINKQQIEASNMLSRRVHRDWSYGDEEISDDAPKND